MAGVVDSNMWYQLSYGNDLTTAIQAYDINSSGTGAVIGRLLNSTTNQNTFQWQFFRLNTTEPTYVLRSRYLGNQWYAASFWMPLASLQGLDTRIRTENYKSPDLVPKAAQWTVDGSDGSGRFYLSTVINGTGFRLDSYQGICYLKDANTGVNTNGLKWQLRTMTPINDQQWSYTQTASATSTSSTSSATSSLPASISATATGASTTQTSQNSTSSSSTPIGAIVGGVVGGLVVLILIIAAIILRHRRKRKQDAQKHYSMSPYVGSPREIEGKQLYGPTKGPVARTVPGVYEKERSPLDYTQPPQQHWGPAVELPAESPGSLRPMYSTSTRS